MLWQNWARTVQARPVRVERPASADEAAAVLTAAACDGLRVKPVGAGHSFTPIAATDGVQVRLDGLSGLLSLDTDARTATVGAGTRLHELNALLTERGYGLTNMGDIAVQTVSGAIATGTHGSGRASASLSEQVVALEIVLPDGSVRRVSAADTGDDGDLFQAARLGLGALGIVTSVTFRIEPAFTLRSTVERTTLDAVVERLPDLEAEDHCDLYWLPFTDAVQLTVNRRTGEPAAPPHPVASWWSGDVIENAGVALVQRVTRAAPKLTPSVNAVAARLIGDRTFVDLAPKVFTSTRRVRFHEMEYALPRSAAAGALRALRDLTARGPWRVAFPVEIRLAPADDVWLSPAYGRDTVYVATHAYPRTDYTGWFSAVEKLWTEYGGRPHWGKLHTRDSGYLRDQYRQMGSFRAVRDRVDPGRIMANAYLDRILDG
ncbi:D-arabinono-1,4-lactone oxidase [Jiangella rhizosphaerae]|uniref:FAD-binding protein n=1 Tax=Jiangella rhizosphaerae TaxID=2293569 RepID=A0A418KU88_9ACTN|nr:D-arabinono-1,4-lactone oxidase [Jiangella rhizosphaerae]RIQ32132.1 FAD-binding protein [Jiangella rhizosphaerae]